MHVWLVGGVGGRVATVTDIHQSVGVCTRWEQRDVLRRIVHIVSTTALSHAVFKHPCGGPLIFVFLFLLSSELPFQCHRQKLNPFPFNSTPYSAYWDRRPRQVCVGYFNAPHLRKKSFSICVCICVHWNKREHSRAQTTNEFPLWELINRDDKSRIWSRQCWVTSCRSESWGVVFSHRVREECGMMIW